jgi:hypothetical protein
MKKTKHNRLDEIRRLTKNHRNYPIQLDGLDKWINFVANIPAYIYPELEPVIADIMDDDLVTGPDEHRLMATKAQKETLRDLVLHDTLSYYAISHWLGFFLLNKAILLEHRDLKLRRFAKDKPHLLPLKAARPVAEKFCRWLELCQGMWLECDESKMRYVSPAQMWVVWIADDYILQIEKLLSPGVMRMGGTGKDANYMNAFAHKSKRQQGMEMSKALDGLQSFYPHEDWSFSGNDTGETIPTRPCVAIPLYAKVIASQDKSFNRKFFKPFISAMRRYNGEMRNLGSLAKIATLSETGELRVSAKHAWKKADFSHLEEVKQWNLDKAAMEEFLLLAGFSLEDIRSAKKMSMKIVASGTSTISIETANVKKHHSFSARLS